MPIPCVSSSGLMASRPCQAIETRQVVQFPHRGRRWRRSKKPATAGGRGSTELAGPTASADPEAANATTKGSGERASPAHPESTNAHHACRFCGSTSGTRLSAAGSVCSDRDCQEHAELACGKTHHCGHRCGGVKDELSCLPCLHGCDRKSAGARRLRQRADDVCAICFTDALGAAPAVQLDGCGHVFHLRCARRVLQGRWPGARITFGFTTCPVCNDGPVAHPLLRDLLEPVAALREAVRRMALTRLEYDGLRAQSEASVAARLHDDPASFAMDRYAYYICYKCKKPYFGGEARCDDGGGDDYDPSELVCGECTDVARAQACAKHGTTFLEYKCRFCCTVAVFFCFGTTHFCHACHDSSQMMLNMAAKGQLPQCPAGPCGNQLNGTECPLRVAHPRSGEEFALGCGVCWNAYTF